MENGVVFAGLSVIVTLLTSLFKTVNLSVKEKNLIATGLSVVAGAVTVWINSNGDFNGASVASVAVATYGASQLAYNFILKGTGLDNKLTTTNLFGTDVSTVQTVVDDTTKFAKAVKKAPAKKSTTTTKKTTK